MVINAFIKLLPSFPSPVLPLFKEDGDERSKYYVQDISQLRQIDSFVPLDQDVDSNRIIIRDVQSGQVKKSIGDTAVYSYAISDGHIVLGDITRIAKLIRDNIDKVDTDKNCFAYLEFANLLQDDELILKAAMKCRDNIQGSNPKLTRLWIDGAPLSEKLKAELSKGLSAVISQTDVGDISIATERYGFSGPYALTTAITAFCYAKGLYRSHMIEEFFERDLYLKDADRLLSNSGFAIDFVMLNMNRIGNRAKGYISLPSRGATFVKVKFLHEYYSFRTAFSAKLREYPNFKEYRSKKYFNSGSEHLSFLILVTYLMSKFKEEFEEYTLEYCEKITAHHEEEIKAGRLV